MNQDLKKKLAPKIKEVLKKYGVFGTISVKNHSTLQVTVRKGTIDFGDLSINGGLLNPYHSNGSSDIDNFRDELYNAMNDGNHDNSDVMSDYFDVGWYAWVYIGEWNKPYEFKGQ